MMILLMNIPKTEQSHYYPPQDLPPKSQGKIRFQLNNILPNPKALHLEAEVTNLNSPEPLDIFN